MRGEQEAFFGLSTRGKDLGARQPREFARWQTFMLRAGPGENASATGYWVS